MANINIGGDPENYMEAPRMSVGGGGGGGGAGFISSLLDLLGIHKSVANVEQSGPAEFIPEIDTSQPKAAPPSANLPALDAASSVFQSSNPMTSSWGEEYLKKFSPIERIDPDIDFQ